jgi:hypothetical protein
MYLTYCDESGNSSFSEQSIKKSNYFCVCSLTIKTDQERTLNNIIKTKSKHLYKIGWPKEYEIKANRLYGLKRDSIIPSQVKQKINGDEYIQEILNKVSGVVSPRIDYIGVDKAKITSHNLKTAPYGIAYNYFAGKMLIPLIIELESIDLIIDQRNKEAHEFKHFDGHIKTKIIEETENENKKIRLRIHHKESHQIKGLQVVDFFSWAIFRKIRSDDDRFFNVFKDQINIEEKWYI